MLKRLISILLLVTVLFTGCGMMRSTNAWQKQYDLGMRYLREGNYEEAVLAFEAAIEVDPRRTDAYLSLAETYMCMDEFDQAMKILENGVENAEDTYALENKLEEVRTQIWQREYDLAEYHLINGQLEKAITILQGVIIIDGTRAEGYIKLAETYLAQENEDQAIGVLKEGYGYAEDISAIEQKLQELGEGEWLETAERKQWVGSDESKEEIARPDERPTGKVVSGTCGSNLIWEMEIDTGTLYISGTGSMDDYIMDGFPGTTAPWDRYRNGIEHLRIGTGVTTVGSLAFFYYPNLEDVTLPDSLTEIHEYAFQDCDKLAQVKLPEHLKMIDIGAFQDCIGLQKIEIPTSVTTIAEMAFQDCYALTEIIYQGTQEQWQNIAIGPHNFENCADIICYNG